MYGGYLDTKGFEGDYEWEIKAWGMAHGAKGNEEEGGLPPEASGIGWKRESNGKISILGSVPLVTYISPKGTTVEESPVIEFSVKEDVALDSVSVKVDGRKLEVQGSWLEGEGQSALDGTYTFSVSVNWPLYSGDHVVDIQAWDKAGNESAPEGRKLTIADQVTNIIDRSGDSHGGMQITRYPLGLSRDGG